MTKRILRWSLFLTIDLFVAFVFLLAYFEWPDHLLYLVRGSAQPCWLNVTPNRNDTIPIFFMIRYSPCPLPEELNASVIAGVEIDPDRPVTLRGMPNDVRYWSFVFYPRLAKKHSSELASITSRNIELEPDGSYEVTFSPYRQGKNWVDTGFAASGIIFMRNYVPAPGSRITLPAIYYGDTLCVPAEEFPHGR